MSGLSKTGPIPSGRGILVPALPGTGKAYASFADVMDSILDGGFTVPELTEIRRTIGRTLTQQRKTGMIMTGATIEEGDRVRINANYYSKSMVGVTGTVKEVLGGANGKSVWVSVKFWPDALPKRRPKYAVGVDGLVHVAGNCVDPLPRT
jgi:hypothetical protein